MAYIYADLRLMHFQLEPVSYSLSNSSEAALKAWDEGVLTGWFLLSNTEKKNGYYKRKENGISIKDQREIKK